MTAGALGAPAVVRAALATSVVAAVLPAVAPIFADSVALALLAGWAVPTAVALLSMSWSEGGRRPGAGGILAGSAARLAADVVGVGAILLILPDDPSGRGALSGLAAGAARLLSVSLPAAAAGPQLGIAVVAVAVAAALAAEIAHRTTGRLAPLVPGLALLGVALLTGSGGATPPRWVAPVVVAACGSTMAAAGLRRPATTKREGTRGEPQSARRAGVGEVIPIARLATAGVILVVIAAAMIPLGSHLPGAHASKPYVLRAALAPPPQPRSRTDPLAGYAAIHDIVPPAPALSVVAPGTDLRGVYWRLAVLDAFDGTAWRPTSIFRPAGRRLPPGPPRQSASTLLRARVTLLRPSPYLPAPDRPVATSLSQVQVDEATGVLAALGPSTMPLTYELRAQIATPDEASLLDATIPAGNPNVRTPPPPAELASLGQGLVRSARPDAFDRLVRLRNFLIGSPFTLQAPGQETIGSGYFQIKGVLADHTGSAEQYAAAFAVLARTVGFHTRLAVGYLNASPSGRDGQVTYTTADYTVWPEVRFDGLGWEPFPIVPAAGVGSGGAASAPSPPGDAVSAALDRQGRIDQARPPADHGLSPVPDRRRGGSGLQVSPLATVPIGIAALVMALAMAVVGAKGWRLRGQRHRPDPALRLAGAWEHTLDRLAELGIPLAASLTAGEVADRAVAGLGNQRARPVAGLVDFVDSARYDRRFPPTTAASDAAWAEARHFDETLRATTPALRRLRARLSLAPLRRHRGRRGP